MTSQPAGRVKIGDRPIHVPTVNPLKYDLMDRAHDVRALAQMLQRLDSPVCIGLQGEPGSGKTTVLRILAQTMRNNDAPTVYLNAREAQFTGPPLAALLAEMRHQLDRQDAHREAFRELGKAATSPSRTQSPAERAARFRAQMTDLAGQLRGGSEHSLVFVIDDLPPTRRSCAGPPGTCCGSRASHSSSASRTPKARPATTSTTPSGWGRATPPASSPGPP